MDLGFKDAALGSAILDLLILTREILRANTGTYGARRIRHPMCFRDLAIR